MVQKRAFPVEEAQCRSGRLIYYLLPSVINTFVGERFLHQAKVYSCSAELYETTQYLGLVPLLCILAGLAFFRRASTTQRRLFLFLLCVMGASLALAMGPRLPLTPYYSEMCWTLGKRSHLVGPAWPFFHLAPMFRFVCRYHVATIFACLALEYFDYSPAHVLDVQAEMPEAYRYLAERPELGPILELNNIDYPVQAHLLGYQVLHERKVCAKGPLQYWDEDIGDLAVQEKYMRMGCKQLVVVTKFPKVRREPLQLPHLGGAIPHWPLQERIGHLKLHKAFYDSLIYDFTPEAVDFTLPKILFSVDFFKQQDNHALLTSRRCCGPEGIIQVWNRTSKPQIMVFETWLSADRGYTVTVESPQFTGRGAIVDRPLRIKQEFTVSPMSEYAIRITTDSPLSWDTSLNAPVAFCMLGPKIHLK